MAKISKTDVDRLQTGRTAWDGGKGAVVGFGVRRQTGAARKYVFKFRINGRQRWMTIGTHGSPWTVDMARDEAKRLSGKVAAGLDPAETRDDAKDNPTVASLADDFLTLHVQPKRKARTYAEYKRLLDRDILPKIGTIRAAFATHSDIAKLHHGMRTAPYSANRCVALLSAMFNWAMPGNYGVATNPCGHIERYAERGRERFLSEDEMVRLSKAIELESNPYIAAAVRLLVFTGCRLSEILTLQWQHVDFDRKMLLLPDSKTGAKVVFLSAPALEILDSLPRVEGNDYVIVGAKTGAHLVNLEKPWRRIRDLAELPDVRLHDLRHSFASVGGGGGLSLPMIGALLGHKSQATTARYAHMASDPVRAANEMIGQRIATSMSSRPSAEVVEFEARRTTS